MSQNIDWVPLKQPCEYPGCKAKRGYWEDGFLICKQGHRQEVKYRKNFEALLVIDISRRNLKSNKVRMNSAPKAKQRGSSGIARRKSRKVGPELK